MSSQQTDDKFPDHLKPKLVDLYRERPYLWNLKHRYYSDRYVRAKGVSEVVQTFAVDGVTVSGERESFVTQLFIFLRYEYAIKRVPWLVVAEQVRKTWDGLLNYYHRARKSSPSGSAAHRQWYLLDQMSFLEERRTACETEAAHFHQIIVVGIFLIFCMLQASRHQCAQCVCTALRKHCRIGISVRQYGRQLH